ncbi:hypothetical protein [Spongiactinospora sp. TRM90649]|uniref:hypothetical protein n=1 Tax=Spongiactinospora sp. TRM90649 TaxID=3031114 RepID=UPI0023F71BE6|nr:hypothetical protein [Spongiactinospora sp. TRM90649]MDF5752192.1 hypothetical protein [Spongiactinospora sp. TRM90649]
MAKRLSAHTSTTMPTSDSAAPRASHRPGRDTRDSGRMSTPAASATTMNGTFTRNAACQEKYSSRNPPTPSTARTPITAPADPASSTSADAPPNTANPVSSMRRAETWGECVATPITRPRRSWGP